MRTPVVIWVVTSWYGPELPFRPPPGVGAVRLVDSRTTWVNGRIVDPPLGTWVWATRPSVARRYTKDLPNRTHILAAAGGHPSRLGRRRQIPLLKNKTWCAVLFRKLSRLNQEARRRPTAPPGSSESDQPS